MTIKGTFEYSPPEILMNLKYSGKCDVFSFGVVLYILLYGKHPIYSNQVLSNLRK